MGPELHRTSHEIRRALDAYLAASGDADVSCVTGMRGMVLNYIVCCTKLGGDVYQRDIEAKFHIRRSSVTALLQSMEQMGLITRQAVTQDARLKSLVPTERGRLCSQKCLQTITDFEDELQQGIGAQERAALLATLQKLSANVERLLRKQKGEKQK